MKKQTAFARNIKALREDSGLTQVELGKKLETESMTISRWERSEIVRPHPKTVEQLCEYFGVTSGDLLSENGDDATVKRVKFMDGIAVLEPDSSNPDHRRRMIDSSDPESPEVRILGKVVYAVTRF